MSDVATGAPGAGGNVALWLLITVSFRQQNELIHKLFGIHVLMHLNTPIFFNTYMPSMPNAMYPNIWSVVSPQYCILLILCSKLRVLISSLILSIMVL